MKQETSLAPIQPGMATVAIGLDIYSSPNPIMRELQEAVAGLAVADLPILLIGEKGTGKEVIGRLIHTRQGGRADTFLTVPCSITNPLYLRTLFIELTQPQQDTLGATRSVFFDDICDLTPSSQAALVEALHDSYTPHSDHKPVVRIISATSRSPEEEIRTKRFREDLFYRLNGVSLRVPPLRHRKEDIPSLLNYFLTLHTKPLGYPPMVLRNQTMEALLRHSWPGNIRELEEFVKTVLFSGEQAALADLKAASTSTSDNRNYPSVLPLKEATKKASRQVERELILNTLARTRWNRKRAARVLGISYKALLYKLKRIALDDSQ